MFNHFKMVEFWSREAQSANRSRKLLAKIGKTDEADRQRDYEQYAQAQIAVHQFKAVNR